MATIKSSDLDFDAIKESLKTYLQRQDEFNAYNFEASGLSNILDVLAYNTHLNGLIANFGINESFLKSSQLRSSVLAHAESLGYYPKSKTGSSATVTLSVTTSLSSPSTITLPANTKFSSNIDGVSYSFQTTEAYSAQNVNGVYTFTTDTGSTSITIKEGSQKLKSFLIGEVSEDQVYVIPDPNVDTSTMVVRVYESPSSESFESYNNINSVARIDASSTVYTVREAPNGFFEVVFSNGNVLGKTPEAGSKVEIEYLSVSSNNSNGGSVFTPDSTVTINNTSYALSVTTVSESAGGSDKESISSIKANAPIAFASQQRLVTAEDYKALISAKYASVIEDVYAWGGNDNVPPEYGKVFVSLKYKTGIDAETKTATQSNITSQLTSNLAIMSIDTEFVDPTTLFLELTTTFNLDPDQTGLTAETLENSVKTLVNTYINNNVNSFGKAFRRSNILSDIDDFSPAILDSKIDVKAQLRFTPSITALSNYSINFPIVIASADDVSHKVVTSQFTYNSQSAFIRNKLGSSKLQIVSTIGDVLKDNVGSYNPLTGVITISGFQPTAVASTELKVSVIPANQATIIPKRNYIIDVDTSVSSAIAVLDYLNTSSVI